MLFISTKKKNIVKRIISVAIVAEVMCSAPTTHIMGTESGSTGTTIKIHTPVVVGASNQSVQFDGLYAEITVTPNNTGTHISSTGYGTRNYVYSLTNKLLLKEFAQNVTNAAGKVALNGITFPFGVWDSSTGKYYPAYTHIILGTQYAANGTATSGTRFIIPASAIVVADTRGQSMITTSVAVNAPEILYTSSSLFQAGTKQNPVNFKTINGMASSYYMQNLANTSTSKYAVYATANLNYASTIGKLTLNDLATVQKLMTEDKALYLGDEFSFYIDTSGAFHKDAGSKVVITPVLTYIDADGGNERSVNIMYGFEYSLTQGVVSHLKALASDTTRFSYKIPLLNSQPSDTEYKLTKALLNHYATASFNWEQSYTFSSIEIPGINRFLIDIKDKLNPMLANALPQDSLLADVNADGIEDDLQKTQARWYAKYHLPKNLYITEVNLKKGFCSRCNEHQWGKNITRCPECNTTLTDVTNYTLNQSTEQDLVYHKDKILLRDGYIRVKFNVSVTDSNGAVLTKSAIPVVSPDGTALTLRYAIDKEAEGDWIIIQ